MWESCWLCWSVLSRPTGDTIDRLSTLHEMLTETADWPRVVQCAQTVPVLLHIFFNTVIAVNRLHIQYINNCSYRSLKCLGWMLSLRS